MLTAAVDAFAAGPDGCSWIELSMRDLLCDLAGGVDQAVALRQAETMTRSAVATGLVEFATRAAVHRARWAGGGQREDALAEARGRAADQHNPALVALAGGPRGGDRRGR
jgi:hypothetical protein